MRCNRNYQQHFHVSNHSTPSQHLGKYFVPNRTSIACLTDRLFQLTCVFAAYGVVIELLRPTSEAKEIIFLNALGFVFGMSLVVAIAQAGSSLTKEAEATSTTISQVMTKSELSDAQKIDFICFMAQARSRNLNLQSSFFVINWNILLAVGYAFRAQNRFLQILFFQIISTIVTYLVITCQFEASPPKVM